MTSPKNAQPRVSEVLSDEEHRSARATTLNAHYTAPTVIGAMYRAAERFGFKGGRVLDTRGSVFARLDSVLRVVWPIGRSKHIDRKNLT
jgi:hypothetical protein